MIEDNPSDARLINELLSEEKFAEDNIKNVNRLSKGLECLAAGNLDAVLLDLDLPDSHGIETFEKIYSAAPGVPILILTGLKDDAFALEAVGRGAQDYLIKGKFDSALLVRAINYAIERKKLVEAVKRQADLIDLSPDAIIIKKTDDTIAFWSSGAEKLYGYTKDQAIGKKAQLILKTKSTQPFETIAFKLSQDGKWSGELCHQTKSGNELSIQSYWLARFDKHHNVKEIFESDVDITERKNAERLAAIGATAGMVGHDIRNPLQAMTSDVYLAKTELASTPDSEEKRNALGSLEEIEKNIDYINKIVADLQDFARPLIPHAEETDLKLIIDGLLTKNCVPDNVQLTVKVEEDARKIVADPSFINRIIVNLVSNAVQAMPKGGELEIHAFKEVNDVILAVKDTGIGISDKAKAKLFTPLFTTKPRGQGFGLAVIKRMTEALGGTVSFESKEGKGTTFIIRFPFLPKELNGKWTYK